MKIYCTGRAVIEDSVSGEKHEVFPDELTWETTGGGERKMGLETLYEAALDHSELGKIRWSLSEYPVGVENYKNTDVGTHRLLEDFNFGLEHETDFEFDPESSLSEENKKTTTVAEMVQWFHALYEDPQNETPYDSEDGRYIYVYGGPYDASEVLQNEFGNQVSDHLIEQAVAEIEGDGTLEWAPSPYHPDQILAAQEFDEQEKLEKLEKRTGSGLFVRREAQDQILNRERLALGLAHLLKSASGEFTFALLGSWGSGKTTLAASVSKYLLDPERYSAGVKRAFGVTEAEQKRYSVVEFNAWKYQKKPELWVYLYESFLAEFLSTSFVYRNLRVVRAGLQKNGLASTLFSLLILAFSAFPLMWMSKLLPYANAVFGVSGLVGLALLAHRWHASLRKLYDSYGVVSSHSKHLGMQAVIGKDLRAIVKSQVKGTQFTRREKLIVGGVILLVGIAWVICAFQIDAIGSKIPVFTALVIWVSVGSLFLSAMVFNGDRVDRILLIVDDLDRCHADEILDLIDGVKLLVDDGEIGEFVQVMTLADSEILRSAIETRFNFNSNEVSAASENTSRVVEHIQKVFLCHLRLPSISDIDVMDLVEHCAKEFGVEGSDVSQNAFETQPESSGSSTERKTQPDSTEDIGDFILSQSEVNSLMVALGSHVNEHEISMTPRAVRSFLFKYQILRMLLRLNRLRYDHRDLANLLNREIAISRGACILPEANEPADLLPYVKMVA
ncbi:P-loop NTPase fold protein [Phaeobacter gallaeciensis]|uniref:P-loop NTPase fold protein n=1 Tax=Phaeobacter gallaeciensis TaxID=60890 RepID=UPI00237F8282|nr:P-loop NTPase fold protein [Phaeobacter gallaeciensis]MDE4139992.1 P-loop NTPase fold protein [Phaeobacter gallaeciensis]MDE4148398.1 P-loop NTPase fold protein [Phaeobacter gallaeciensis]MDE4152658.1 P-loop NTPase fold protein [Phaeobacter gallaeciensis]MDE4228008.1 P-loop NTPase fold protein [Phaeobacter gallaeciensis]MDE4257123.1 P-loop NTPase fold protein [Phaeobacter gallaeciensis]